MPLDGEYQLPPDSTLFGTSLAALPRDDLDLALTEITAALDGYQHAEEYDSVNLWEQNMLSREGRTLRQADIEFDPNFCSPVIDAVNDRLLISSITATAGAVTDAAATDAATGLVQQVVEANELDTRYREWNRNALRDGDAYVIVWPTETPEVGVELSDDRDVTGAGQATVVDGVNITYADPRNCRMFYDPENPRRKLFFAQMWQMQLKGEKKPRIRMNLFYPDRIEKWISAPGDKQKAAKEFTPFLDPDLDDDNDYPGSGADSDGDAAAASSWPMPNPYGQVPVFHLRTAYEYGKPEHRNAFALQDGISKLVEMLMVTVEFNGYPQRYAIQQADSLGTQSIREDPLAEHSPADWDHDFTETALSTTSIVSGAISNETGSNYEANPGGMQVFKGFETVSQFQSANPAAFLDPLKEFITGIANTTSTPIWKFSGLGSQTPSGEALRIAEQPLVRKIEDRMAMFGGVWRDVYEFALAILGHGVKVQIQWANPATNDLKETWDLVQQKVSAGMPREIAFMQAGIPEAQAAEWANTYSTFFAEAEYQQGRAKMYSAQADLLTQQAIAAKIANGMPELVAWVEAGYAEAEVDGWLTDNEQQNSLSRKIGMFGQITAGLQQLGLAIGLNVISEEGANAIVTQLFGDLLPELPRAVYETEPEDEPTDEQPEGEFPQLITTAPARTEDGGYDMPPGFATQLPPGSVPPAPIPPQDR
jgi:hypothetical protein